MNHLWVSDCAGYRFLGSVESESQTPESVAMAVAVFFSGEPDMTGAGDFPTHTSQVCSHGIREGNFNGAIFKSDTHGVGEFFFDPLCKGDALDLKLAKGLGCAFGELPSQSRLIDATPAHHWQFQKFVERLLLAVEGL